MYSVLRGDKMIDENKLICYCNDLTIKDIVEIIKKKNIKSMDDLIQQSDYPVGDKCESCHEDGYQNDGYSLAMVLSLVKQKRL